MLNHFTSSALLDTLALKYGTDKGSCDHDYMPYYTQYLEPLRDKPITLLELGIWKGASLRMWRAYFSKATIIGLDNHVKSLPDMAGIHTVLCEQDDKEGLDGLAEMYGQFDVIIDDASHISSKTITSFQYLYPHLKDGGLYVIEDLQTSYDAEHYGENEACSNPNEGWYTAMGFCKRLADEVHPDLFPSQYRSGLSIASVQFFPNICFIVKGETWTTS